VANAARFEVRIFYDTISLKPGKVFFGGSCFFVDVEHFTATNTNEMIVWLKIPVEANRLLSRFERPDETEIRQEPKRSINGIEGHRRQSNFDTLEQRFGIGMIVTVDDFAKDLQTLMGHLDLSSLTSPFEFG
jgi:hypothetical protein